MSLPNDFASISKSLCFLSLDGASGKGTSCCFCLGPNTDSPEISAFTVSQGDPSQCQVPCKGSFFSSIVWNVGVVVGSGALGVLGMCVGHEISRWFVVRVSVLTFKGIVDLVVEKEY